MGIKPQIDGGNYVFTWSNTGLYPGIENEWPYNEGGCENGMYSVDGITYPCSDTFHNGIPLQKYDDSGLSTEEQVKLGLKYDQYSGAKGTTAGGCVIGEYIDTNGLSADEKVILLAYYLNQLKKPITFTTVVSGVGYPGDNGFLTNEFFKNGAIATFGEDTAKNGGGGHKLLFVGFIPREFIPEKVKMHHDFVPNEDYFIIKNSWGKYFGDNGFLYATASQVVKYTYEYYAYEYDTDSKYFPGCDSLRSKVVYDKVTEQTVKAKLGYN
jgi:hypothetical protein